MATKKEDLKRIRVTRAVKDMVKSKGWEESFPVLMDKLKEVTYVGNIEDEVALKAAQMVNEIFSTWLAEIYDIVITKEQLMAEPDNELYEVLSGADKSSLDEF